MLVKGRLRIGGDRAKFNEYTVTVGGSRSMTFQPVDQGPRTVTVHFYEEDLVDLAVRIIGNTPHGRLMEHQTLLKYAKMIVAAQRAGEEESDGTVS